MQSGDLFIISAPSGTGKTRLVNALIEREPNLFLSVSHTTRFMRPGEVDGTDYHFVDHKAFKAMVLQSDFLEHAEVFGNYYGTARSSVNNQLATGQDVLLEIDWQGAAQIRRLSPNSVFIFIAPPSREVLEQRLRDRGQDTAAVIGQRMAAARDEMSHYAEADYLIVNDDFEIAVEDALAIIRAKRLEQVRQAASQAELLAALLLKPS